VIPRLALLAWALFAAACGPRFTALSTPPITRTARLDTRAESIELSTGVALAFECHAASGQHCIGARASSDDPAVARVLPAYMDDLSERWGWHSPAPHWAWHGSAPRSAFVVYGVAPGKTVLRVRSDNGDEELAVTVID
jgi:hypothetical protein